MNFNHLWQTVLWVCLYTLLLLKSSNFNLIVKLIEYMLFLLLPYFGTDISCSQGWPWSYCIALEIGWISDSITSNAQMLWKKSCTTTKKFNSDIWTNSLLCSDSQNIDYILATILWRTFIKNVSCFVAQAGSRLQIVLSPYG